MTLPDAEGQASAERQNEASPTKHGVQLGLAFVAAALIGAPNAQAGPPHARMEVGIRCQQEYQNTGSWTWAIMTFGGVAATSAARVARPTTSVSISTCTARRRRSKRPVMAAARLVAVPIRWIFCT